MSAGSNTDAPGAERLFENICNKEELKDWVREQARTLNDCGLWQLGAICREEIEPKFELLRRLNRDFSLGIPECDLKDHLGRMKDRPGV